MSEKKKWRSREREKERERERRKWVEHRHTGSDTMRMMSLLAQLCL